MSLKVLITCPPMLEQIDQFRNNFAELGIEITTPDVVQSLTVKELMELVPKHDGWIIGDDPANAQVFEAGRSGKLRAAVKWGVGVDNVDFSACERLGIPVENTPGVFGAEVADLAMCYMLGLARDAFLIDREIRSGLWPKHTGVSLTGKTLGIVGLGDIGTHIARRAHAHGLNILAWDPYVENTAGYIKLSEQWPDGVVSCDFLVFACALTTENNHMFDESILARLKHGTMLINVSRGQLIKEAALLKGLSNGVIAAAALDVFEIEPLRRDSEIFKYPKCILGAHNGSNTFEAVQRTSIKAIGLLNELLKQTSNAAHLSPTN